MTSAAPVRKPYRKAPPQHREARHALPVPAPAPQHDINQVNKPSLNTTSTPLQHLTHISTTTAKRPPHGTPTSPPLLSDSELDVSSLSSLELCIPPPPLFSSQSHRTQRHRTTVVGIAGSPRSPVATKKPSPTPGPQGQRHSRTQRMQTATAPRSILKQTASLGVGHTYDIIRKSKSVELLDDSRGRGSCGRHPPTRSLDRSEQHAPISRRSSDPPSPCGTNWNWRMQVLEEKVRFSNFLDEITGRIMSPAHLTLLGRIPPSKEKRSPAPERRRPALRKRQMEVMSADRTRRWDNWVTAMQRPNNLYQFLQEEGAGRQKSDITEGAKSKQEVLGVNRGVKMEVLETKEPQRHKSPVFNQSLLSHIKVGPPAPPAAPSPAPPSFPASVSAPYCCSCCWSLPSSCCCYSSCSSSYSSYCSCSLCYTSWFPCCCSSSCSSCCFSCCCSFSCSRLCCCYFSPSCCCTSSFSGFSSSSWCSSLLLLLFLLFLLPCCSSYHAVISTDDSDDVDEESEKYLICGFKQRFS